MMPRSVLTVELNMTTQWIQCVAVHCQDYLWLQPLMMSQIEWNLCGQCVEALDAFRRGMGKPSANRKVL